jgi:hypothetical protein
MNNLNVPLQTGTALQTNQQGQDEANLAQYQMNQQMPWQTLANYWGIVGGTGYGQQSTGTTTGKTTNTPSGLQDVQGVQGAISDPRMKIINDDPSLKDDPELNMDYANPKTDFYTNALNAPSGNTASDFLTKLLQQNAAKSPSQNGPTAGMAMVNPGAGIPSAPVSIGPAKTDSAMGSLGSVMGMGGGGGGGMISDPRMKVTGGKTHDALSKIDDIDLYKARYKWEPPGADRPMMMAPQVQKVLPNAVTGVPNGPQVQTIKMNDMIPVIVGALKELNAKVGNTKKRKK